MAYDRTHFNESLTPLRIMRYLKRYFKGKGLDIGADNGRHLYLMPEGSVGLDFYTSYFKEFKKRGYKSSRADLDSGKLPFKDSTFDFVLCSHTLEHVQMPNSLVKEMHRVLKEGGRLLVAVPNAKCIYYDFYSKRTGCHINVFDALTLRKLLTKEGFKIKRRLTNFPSGSWIAFLVFNYTPIKYIWDDIWYICDKR